MLVLGLTFKEDVKDVRNSRVFDLIQVLDEHGVQISVHDPFAQATGHRLRVVDDPFSSDAVYDAVVLAVPHRAFRERAAQDFLRQLRRPGVLIDVRGVIPRETVESAGVSYWRL